MIKETVYTNDDFQILTDDGWKDIKNVHKTNYYEKFLILFESGREIECADNHVFIKSDYDEVFAKDLTVGDILISEDGFDIVFDVFNTQEHEEFYDFTIKDHSLYFSEGILSHNTNFLVNAAARQTLRGYNPLILSLEMSEDALCKRLDSIYTKLDINKIYVDNNISSQMFKELKKIKESNGLGNLIVKEFPTGNASVSDFDAYIRELKYRGIKVGPIYCDYLQLMKSDSKTKQSKRHDELREISENLRALSLKWGTPVISVSQLNREGMFTSFNDVDFTYIAEGISISATSDFMAIFGRNESDFVYESELHYKIVKNRIGGRVGETGKLFVDKRSLKMYDESELDLWIEESKISGDSRKVNKMKD